MEAVRKKIKTTAGFGAAMATVYTAPELSADIVGLNFSPGAVDWASSSSTMSSVAINTTGGQIGGFTQWNNSSGKTFSFNGPSMQSWRTASAGEVLNVSNFSGVRSGIFGTGSTSAAGTVYVGFKANDGNVGWFAANLGGSQGAVTYTDGQFGNAGESVTVGAVAVPEPSAFGLSLLALGAVGLRRRRAANK